MNDEKYHRIEGTVLTREQRRGVVDVSDHVYFACPCGERMVRINKNIHDVSFEDSFLHIDPSIASSQSNEPKNYCHFWVEHGQYRMEADSKCPGVNL